MGHGDLLMMWEWLYSPHQLFIPHLDILHVTDDQPCAQRLTSTSCQMAGRVTAWMQSGWIGIRKQKGFFTKCGENYATNHKC